MKKQEILETLINLVKSLNDLPEDHRSNELNKALGEAYYVIQKEIKNKKWSEIFLKK
jgi:hypothetical protein